MLEYSLNLCLTVLSPMAYRIILLGFICCCEVHAHKFLFLPFLFTSCSYCTRFMWEDLPLYYLQFGNEPLWPISFFLIIDRFFYAVLSIGVHSLAFLISIGFESDLAWGNQKHPYSSF